MAPTPASSSSKKRKADKVTKSGASPSSTSKKKLSSIRVEVSPNNPEYDPVVVSFPRGNPGSDDPPRFTCSQLKANSSRGRRITGEDDSCTYSASAAGRGHDGRLTKMYVCIYDKKKKALKVVPSAEKGTVFALEQTVKGYTPNVANGGLLFGSGQTQQDGEKVMSASDRNNMLVESFGSKKKQKVMASRAANKVNINSVVGAGDGMMRSVEMQKGISTENKKGMNEGSKMVNPTDMAYEEARQKMLPPYDINANEPSKVYNAESIAGTIAWVSITRFVNSALAKKSEGDKEMEWIDSLLGTKGYRPPSIVTLLKSIDPSKKSSQYRMKVTYLLFSTLRFHKRLQRRGIIEGASVDDCVSGLHITHEVGLRLFELFTTQVEGKEGGGYSISKQQKDKLHSYILILYVIAGGKDMKVASINQLCKDMNNLDTKSASLLMREAGFLVKKSASGDVGASLSVPITFPPPRRGKKT